MPIQTIYRPQTLDEVVGNESVVQSLELVLNRENDKPHSFLFTGPAGTGKTSMSRILKNELKCSNSDFYLYNSSNTRGIDSVREIQENCQFSPMNGPIKLFCLEECHQITGPAQEALLVLLEEPPEHVYFALCTTEPGKLKPTLKRRCHSYEMKPLNTIQLNKLINSVLQREGIQKFPDDVVNKIISVCEGSPGIALKLLDMVIDIADDEQAFKAIENSTISESNIAEIARMLINGKGQWQSIASMISGLSGEPESLRRAFLGWFSKALLNSKGQKADRVAEIQMEFMEPLFNTGIAGLRLEIYLAWKSSLV